MKYLAGIKPTGKLHLGHFVSSIKPLMELRDAGHNVTLLIADHHARNTLDDKTIMEYMEPMESYLRSKLGSWEVDVYESEDFSITGFFLELVQLAPMGLLQRNHAYKACKDENPSLGLLTYPILMTADIMSYAPDFVVIGEDQIQHMEIAKELIKRYNTYHNMKIKIPEAQVLDFKVLGFDGEKMSKSKDNCLYLDATDEQIRQYIYKVKTSTVVSTEGCEVLLSIAKAVMDKPSYTMYEALSKTNTTYRDLKEILCEATIKYYDDYVRSEEE